MSIYFFVNLLHSPCVWVFDIWHLFDNLTSFWELGTWVWVMGHMGDGANRQWDTWTKGIVVNSEDIDGVPWRMGHMGNGAHGQHVMCWIMCNFLNNAWVFTKILLHIDIDVFYLNILIFPWWPFLSTKIDEFDILIGLNIGPMISSNTCFNVLVWNLANISVINWSFFKIPLKLLSALIR